MLTRPASRAMLARWRETQREYAPRLRVGRKRGEEIVAYLRDRYPARPLDDPRARSVIAGNVLDNPHLAARLAAGEAPAPVAFRIHRADCPALAAEEARKGLILLPDILAGVETRTGEIHVEGSALVWDDLFAFRGVDARDLENAYLTAEYVACLKRFGRLDAALR